MKSKQARSVYEVIGEEQNSSGIAHRVAQITVSAIKQMPLLASKLGGCVSLGQGIPSLNTPEFIREGLIAALRDNPAIGKYSLQPGLQELRDEVALDLKRTRSLTEVDPDREIFITCGGMEALAAGISTIVERGDEVILPSPTYASHIEQVLFAEGEPRFVPLIEGEGWRLDVAKLKTMLTSKTKAIVLCNPVNPTGTVLSETDVRAIAEIVLEHNLFLVTDEAYDFLVYDGVKYFSPLSLPDLKQHVIGACSFSKRYCMTGFRVGFMYAPARILQQVLKVHDAFAICAPTISQYAALIALQATNGKDGAGDKSVNELCQKLASRRDLVCSRLDKLAEFFSYVKPTGGYYVFPKLLNRSSSIDFALNLLNQAKVITVPGSAFGPSGEGYVRMSFGADEAELNEAFNRIEEFFSQ
jgi:aminotransferase